jgi:hypothetical protein
VSEQASEGGSDGMIIACKHEADGNFEGFFFNNGVHMHMQSGPTFSRHSIKCLDFLHRLVALVHLPVIVLSSHAHGSYEKVIRQLMRVTWRRHFVTTWPPGVVAFILPSHNKIRDIYTFNSSVDLFLQF